MDISASIDAVIPQERKPLQPEQCLALWPPEKAWLSRPLSDVCEKCQGIVNNWPTFSKWVDDDPPQLRHHPNTSALVSAALAGCGICAQFLRGLGDCRVRQPDHEITGGTALGFGDIIDLTIPCMKGDLAE